MIETLSFCTRFYYDWHSYVFADSVLLTQAHEGNRKHFLGFTDPNQRKTNDRVAKLVKLSHKIFSLVISNIYDLVIPCAFYSFLFFIFSKDKSRFKKKIPIFLICLITKFFHNFNI